MWQSLPWGLDTGLGGFVAFLEVLRLAGVRTFSGPGRPGVGPHLGPWSPGFPEGVLSWWFWCLARKSGRLWTAD